MTPAPGVRALAEAGPVYISGPMTGLPEFNYPAFVEAARVWREAGWDVRSPHEAFEGDKGRHYTEYMREDVRMLVECRAIAMLPGWEASRGARMELHVAQMMGLTVWSAVGGVSLDVPTLVTVVPADSPDGGGAT